MKNHFSRAICFPILIAGTLFTVVPLTRAQEIPKHDSGSVKQRTLSDEELRAFAKAYVEHQKIRQVYELRIDEAQDANEKQRIQNEGYVKITEALEKQGLSADAYNQIFTAVNGDDQLKQRALELINEEQSKS